MIRTLQADVLKIGPVSMNLVEVTDEDGGRTEDYEVQCNHIACVTAQCTHLTELEAIQEVVEHAFKAHGIMFAEFLSTGMKVRGLELGESGTDTVHYVVRHENSTSLCKVSVVDSKGFRRDRIVQRDKRVEVIGG